MAYLKNNGPNEYGVPQPNGSHAMIPPSGVKEVACQDGFLDRVQKAHDEGRHHQIEIFGEGYDPGVETETSGGGSESVNEQKEERRQAAVTLLDQADTLDWNEFRANARVLLGDDCPNKKEEIVETLTQIAEDEE